MLDGFTRAMRPLETLSPEELEAIHGRALFVLEKTGMRIDSDRALDMLAGAGCRVDRDKHRVRFPAWLVEECLRVTPTSYVVTARDGRSGSLSATAGTATRSSRSPRPASTRRRCPPPAPS